MARGVKNMGGCQNDTATKRHGASLWHSDKMTRFFIY